ncbi:MAG TPA: RNA-binding S4 domain-containing protein [Erysipelotrichaceae bacterium]|nr:RNA-binding S4 domain-containing protein [Erysipelotrichaceae bacterium]
MRLDKYLKVSRLIKRRTVAKELAASDRILVNDRLAKPSTNLNVDDIITITFGNRTTTFQVLELKDHVRKDEANFMYKMLETSVSEE